MFRRQMYEAMFISLVIIVIFAAICAVVIALFGGPDANHCAQFADTAVKDVPARCMHYWQDH